MSNQTLAPDKSKTRTRSPGYPTTNLEDALERARTIWDADQRNEVTLASMAHHWGYNPKSSSAAQLVAALRKFGLFDHGTKSGSWKLSEFAIRILTNDDPSSPERIALLKTAALGPEIYSDLWQKYAGNPPSDVTIKQHLIADLHFNKKVVDKLIKDFRETITFAKLASDDKLPEPEQPEPLFRADLNVTKSLLFPVEKPPPSKEMRFELDSGPVTVRYPMSKDDFDLLIKSLNLWEKKLVKTPAPCPPLPANAMWKCKDSNRPVKIVALMGEKDGQRYFKSEDGTGIPESELVF